MNAGLVPSVCVAASDVLVPAKAQHGPVEVVEVEGYTGMGMVLSACVVVSEVSVLANVQLGIVVSDTEMDVVAATVEVVVGVHAGTSPETVMVVQV